MKLVFATNNENKIKEIATILNNEYEIIGLKKLDFHEEIPEDYLTLEDNASQKAWFIYNKFGINCFADDTGLEIEALNNEPGVFSARYAGNIKDSNANMDKVIAKLANIDNRKARFRTIISLIIDRKEYRFEGIVKGEIIDRKTGDSGFGYDPIFKPNGYSKTFAQMPLEEKNLISHRALAIKELISFLETL